MSEFSDSESDHSECNDELGAFVKKLFVDDDGDEDDISNPVDLENQLTSHVLESLGALLQTVVKANKTLKKVDQNNPELNTQKARRHALGDALRYFADKLQEPIAPPYSEPYPEKWLRSSFPDSRKASDGTSWLPLHWLVKASTKETCNDNPAIIDDVNLIIVDLHRHQEEMEVSDDFRYPVAPLSIAVAQAYPSIGVVKSLCSHYPKALQMSDADGAYPFFYACAWNKDTSIVEYLHKEYPKIVEKCDNYAFRALHYAAYVGTIDMIQFLLVASPEAAKQPNKYGVLPLNACIVNPNSDVPMLKLVHIVYPKAIRIPDNDGLLPIHKAAEHASLDVIKYLIESYPESTAIPDNEGLLPLHYSGTRRDKSVMVQEYILSNTPDSTSGSESITTSKRISSLLGMGGGGTEKKKTAFKFWK